MLRALLQLYARLGGCEHRWEESRKHPGKQKCVWCRNYRSSNRGSTAKPRKVLVS